MQKSSFVVTALVFFAISCTKNDLKFVPPTINPPLVAANLTVPADSIKLDPFGYTPLSALVNFESPMAGKTYIVVKGKHGAATDIEHLFNDTGHYHSMQVIGLYADYDNTVDIGIINKYGDTVAKGSIKIKTGSLPPNMPTSIEPDVNLNDRIEKGLTLVSNYSTFLPQIPLMTDSYGDIRWVLNYTSHPTLGKLVYDNGIRRLRNGNFFFGDITTDKIYEVDLLGKILNTWDLSTTGFTFHHDIFEKPDGNLISSVTKTSSTHIDGSPTIEDYIVEIDRQNGSIKTIWDLKESLDEYRTAQFTNLQDWIHVNSVLYDSTDNTIIISGRHQGVIKLDFNNRVKWILSAHRGWGSNRRGEDLNQFLLAPLAADGSRIADTAVINGTINHPDFEWCWFQHSTIAVPNGDLMVFDNGAERNFDPSAAKYSRAVEYTIDPVNMTIQQKWQYGKERGLETFSSIVSSVQYLPNTRHVLFCPGYQVPNLKGVGGKVVEVEYDTKEVVSQLSFSAANGWGFHRAKRVSAYPE